MALLVAGCSGATQDEPEAVSAEVQQAAAEETAPVQVRYEIAATGGYSDVPWVDVTESTPGGMSQSKERAPWSSSYDFESGEAVGISAQAGAEVETVRCAIYADGYEVASEESTGEYAVVTCTALLP